MSECDSCAYRLCVVVVACKEETSAKAATDDNQRAGNEIDELIKEGKSLVISLSLIVSYYQPQKASSVLLSQLFLLAHKFHFIFSFTFKICHCNRDVKTGFFGKPDFGC